MVTRVMLRLLGEMARGRAGVLRMKCLVELGLIKQLLIGFSREFPSGVSYLVILASSFENVYAV